MLESNIFRISMMMVIFVVFGAVIHYFVSDIGGYKELMGNFYAERLQKY